MNKINIAIDGYAGTGKSSTAKALANMLGYTYVDSGAMYRAVTLYFIENKIDIQKPDEVEKALNQIRIEFDYNDYQQLVLLNDEDVTADIRHDTINNKVSEVSSIPAVRSAMVKQQRKIGSQKGVVMDGRDIGTNVFPSAELKIFMEADIDVRTIRRYNEIISKEPHSNIVKEDIRENLIKRDDIDSSRSQNPLIKAKDALVINTSKLSFNEQLNIAYEQAKSRISERN